MNPRNTKVDLAYQHIRTLIASDQFQPGDLLPTENVISAELGINRMTIAKALASLKNEGYVERRAGRGTTLLRKPASSSSKIILLISPWPSWNIKDEWYFSRLLYSIQTEAIRNGLATINLAIHAEQIEDNDFAKIRDIYRAVECCGAIVIDPFLATHGKLQEFLADLGCPTVWAGSSQKDAPNAHCIDIDDFQAAFDLTSRLLASGARQIAYISFQFNTAARKRRLEGYRAALAAQGVAANDRLVICNSMPASLREAGRECAGIYTARNLEADAVVLSDLLMLDGVESFCNELHTPALLRLKQLPVATFDYEDGPLHENIRFSATQPIEEIGARTVQVLSGLSAGQQDLPKVQVVDHEIRAFHP